MAFPPAPTDRAAALDNAEFALRDLVQTEDLFGAESVARLRNAQDGLARFPSPEGEVLAGRISAVTEQLESMKGKI